MKNLLTILIFITLLTPQITLGALVDNLISCWELDEESGTRIDAVTASGNDLTDNNTVLFATGKIGNAADFELDNFEFLDISDASQTGLDFGTGAFSLSAWVDIEVASVDGKMLSKRDSGAVAGFNWSIRDSGGGVQDIHMRPNGGSAFNATSDTAVPTSGFQQIAFTRDASGNTTFYLNGSADGTSTGGNNNVSGTGPFQISGMFGTIQVFDGLVDVAAVWDKELTADEVTELFNSGSGISCDNIINPVVAPTGFQWTTIIKRNFEPFIDLFKGLIV